MYNKDKEINQLNALNAKSATKSFRNSLILEDLEADSIADFLRQLSLDDQGRQRSEQEEINRRNADVLDAISKAIAVTKSRAEEKRRKEEEERYQAQRKAELERQKVILLIFSGSDFVQQERERQEKERIRLERVQALENARKKAEEEAAAAKKAAERRKQQAAEEARKKEEQEQEQRKAEASTPVISSNEFEIEFDSHLATIEVRPQLI